MENLENVCHDCRKEIEINGEEIQNGVSLVYDNVTQGVSQKINILKCNDCYAKNPALSNFQECEVYSRVVGYIRPVQQWHKGKKEEYEQRVEFKNPGECCN